jgi:Glycosyltransferase family 87
MDGVTAPAQPSARRWRLAGRWPTVAILWTVALIAASLAGSALAYQSNAACRAGGWESGMAEFQAHCYSDLHGLYFAEGLAKGQIPYLDHPVEYPVLTGAAMQVAAWLVRGDGGTQARALAFFTLSAAMMTICAVAGVLAVGYLAGPAKRWTAVLVALAPGLVLASFISWDMLAMALAMVGLAAWAKRHGVLAGVLLGLAVAAKFYPIVFFGPLLLLCLRAGRMRAFCVTTASALLAWLAVNLPVALIAPAGWSWFYRYSAQRGADWGSIWYYFQTQHWPTVGNLTPAGMNLASGLAFCSLFALIVLLALAAPRRPRLPQLLFLSLVAFLLVNKVWSVQYVIWLVPLAVLARPRLGAFALWQAAEVGYFFAVWAYLITVYTGSSAAGGIGPGLYFAALACRFDTVVLLAILVIRDIVRPAADNVRAAGDDDPAGGVLAGAADRVRLSVDPSGRQLRWAVPGQEA